MIVNVKIGHLENNILTNTNIKYSLFSPLIDRTPWNSTTSLTTYTTLTRISDTNMYTCLSIYINSTLWKAIIGMALQAIKTLV